MMFRILSLILAVVSSTAQNQTMVVPKSTSKTQYYAMTLSSANVLANNAKKYTILINGKFLGNFLPYIDKFIHSSFLPYELL